MSIEEMKECIKRDEIVKRLDDSIKTLWEWRAGVGNGSIERIHVMGGVGFLATDELEREDYENIINGMIKIFERRKGKMKNGNS